MKLVQSPVIFDPTAHTYTLDGVCLQGVTGMIKRQLFPDEYKDVPQSVLDKAAERGTLVHETCELVDTLGITPSVQEAVSYQKILIENVLNHECSEYLVSDLHHFASCIDKVYRVDDTTFDIADIKTTYKLNKEYVQWQLSIYAYFLEFNNPGCKVRNLYAIWLRDDKSEFVQLDRIPEETVKELLSCEIEGRAFKTQEVAVMPENLIAMIGQIGDLLRKSEEIEQQKAALADTIKAAMLANGIKKWETDDFIATYVFGSERASLDTTRLKAEHPDIYAAYQKTTKTKDSIKIKLKQAS